MTYCKIGSHTNASATLNYGEFKNGKKRENIVVATINCTPETAKEEFAFVRNLYGKNDGIQVHTIIQSFDSGVTMEQANKIGIETAQRLFPGHQVVVYTHCDGKGGKIHNHIMANAVNFETGKKYDNHALIYKAREISDEICEAQGLKTIPYDNPTKFEEKLKSLGEKSWKDKLREILDNAKSVAKNLEDFKTMLKSEGITINERNSRKEGGKALTYVVTRTDWGLNGRKIRGRTLGDDYTYAKIVQCIKKPKMTQSEEVTPSSTSTPKQNSIPHNAFKHRKHEEIKKKYNQDLGAILSYCSPIENKTDMVFEDGKPKMVEIPYKDSFYNEDNIMQNLTAIKMIANKDFARAAKILSDEKTMMRYVVNFFGTDSQTLFDAVNAVTNCKGETPHFFGKLMQDTLKLPEYRQAYNHKGQGVWSSFSKVVAAGSNGKGNGRGTVSRVILGRGSTSNSTTTTTTTSTAKRGNGGVAGILSLFKSSGNYARLDVPKMQKQWDDDWAWLSDSERRERQANLDRIDHY